MDQRHNMGQNVRTISCLQKGKNHCLVPQDYKEDLHLGSWVQFQRRNYKKNKMTERHKHLLDFVGFVWDVRARGTSPAIWDEMYQRLVAYKMEHNHCLVPQRYKEDPQLGTWVHTQCRFYKKNKMVERHKNLLDFVGFVSATNTARWDEMYE